MALLASHRILPTQIFQRVQCPFGECKRAWPCRVDAQIDQASLAAQGQCQSLAGLQALRSGTELGAKPVGPSGQGNREDKAG